MLMHLTEWGNSLGIRIPKKYREFLGLNKGSEVEVTLEGEKIVIAPVASIERLSHMAHHIDLERMVNQISSENLPAEEDWESDAPQGKEVW